VSKFIDETGKKFGCWFVTALHPQRSRFAGARWICVCDCGTERIVHGNQLRRGRSQSCGCLQKEIATKRATKHGLSHTRIYRIWQGTKQRCFNARRECYPRYGGRNVGHLRTLAEV